MIKGFIFKLKRWFLENCIYNLLIEESEYLTERFRTQTYDKNIRARFYITDPTSKYPYKLVVFDKKRRVYESDYKAKDLEIIAYAVGFQLAYRGLE